MSIELETLLVRLEADIEDFESQMGGARETTDEYEKSNKKASLSLTDLKSGVDLVKQGLTYLQQGYDATVGKTLALEDSVRQLSNTIGATPEDASKLIAAADDVGIEFGTLQGIMEYAVRAGVKPTIEQIGKLADQYNAIQDPLAKSEFLMKKFGRAGGDLAELMKKGSAGIKELGDSAAETAQVFSQEDLKAAKDLEIALNDLEDAANGVAIRFSKDVIPVLTAAANVMSGGTVAQGAAQVTDAWSQFFEMEISQGRTAAQIITDYKNKHAEMNRIIDEGVAGAGAVKSFGTFQAGIEEVRKTTTVSAEEISAAMFKAASSYDEYFDAVTSAGMYLPLFTEAQFRAAKGTQLEEQFLTELNATMSTAANVSGVMAQQYQTYSTMAGAAAIADREAAAAALEQKEAAKAHAEALAGIADALSFALEGPVANAWQTYMDTVAQVEESAQKLEDQYHTAYQQTLPEYKNAVDKNNEALDTAKEKFSVATKEILYQRMAINLDAEAALDLARTWGLISETDYNIAKATQAITEAFDKNKDGLIDADEAAGGFQEALDAVAKAAEDGKVSNEELFDILNKLNGKHFKTTLDVETNYSAIGTGGPAPIQLGVGGGGDTGGGGGTPAPIETAVGGDFWVTEPTMFLAGESGDERVTVTPQGQPMGGVGAYNSGYQRSGDTIIINDQLAASMYMEQRRREKVAALEAGM